MPGNKQNIILKAIKKWADQQPHSPAVSGMNVSFTYRQLQESICEWQAYLEEQRPNVLGILMDNSPAWVVIDLAAQAAGIPVLPIPAFFSEQQINHALNETTCDCIVTDQPERFRTLDSMKIHTNKNLFALTDDSKTIWELRTNLAHQSKLSRDITKITYTSGTTGTPKGVCLTQAVIDTVAQSLCTTVEMNRADIHFCALPLATLLENIAGVYVPLLAGAQSVVLPMEKTGLRGATAFDVTQFHNSVSQTGATTTVMVPHLLQQLVEYYEQAKLTKSSLRFIAVGGAPVAPELLLRAFECNLPVYEGYGLSECASVVAVNTPHQFHPGSVGKPLPHITITFADDGEILVKGACFSTYLGQENVNLAEYLATGDTGYLDDEGYLYITGRKKNMFITAFGRNVSPEWIEQELVIEPAIKQAAVFGEGRAWNTALIVAEDRCTNSDINNAIAKVNKKLPDYARIKTWIAASEPFTVENQQLTATGRLRRNHIWQTYANRIADLYSSNIDPRRKSA